MKKVLAYILSLSMITSSLVLFAQADSVIGNIDMDTEIVEPISQTYPFDFELVSVEDNDAVVSMESRIDDYTFYLGVKGEKEEISPQKSSLYHVEVEKEYAFVYTHSLKNQLNVYNGTLIVEDYGNNRVYVKLSDVVLNTTHNGTISNSVKNSASYVVLSAGEKDEVESNDTYGLADRTYDDYDNYGTIDTESDIDW